ncbi:dimethylamine monooxygenase subunit DmmA family protein [Corynebacterium variabile]|uniref:dimethylamine monooxygenase subunit DmmA family protein n=1 Tax=Corynebacterium variabile TaxID=1727 RepID=UPI0028AE537B|nr:dimethylamine monooxygenase subunit DmmA family protein [Corynebacterium variabile]
MTATTADTAPAPPATSLPRWSETPPPVDDTSSEQMLVLCDGDDGAGDHWLRDLRARGIEPLQVRVLAPRVTTPALLRPGTDRGLTGLPQLRRMLDTATVGLRLLVTGTEWQVLTVVAAAREAGMLRSEIRAVATAPGISGDAFPLIVFCVHCEAETLSPAATPGTTVRCAGCARLLDIHPHVNSSQARYLGSDATAGALT